ncbi:MAG: hypothetical protein AAFR37_15785, partial [Cyanobacteria bacterium J06628_3]
SGVVMYNIGQQWGQEDALFFRNWFLQEYGHNDFSQLNLMYVLLPSHPKITELNHRYDESYSQSVLVSEVDEKKNNRSIFL